MSTIEIEGDGTDMFVVRNGVRIAKRGDREWISLEPGFAVYSDYQTGEMTIEFNGASPQ